MISLDRLPKNPGCYLFKDNLDRIIYIGKAKDLSKRVKSYFQKTHEDEKTKSLVKNISSVDFFVTDSEVEALILENNLIKKHKPKYNIDLKDSKRYAYIRKTSEEFPRFLIARKREGEGKFFGPFVNAASRDNVLETVQKIFKIRTCKRLPKRECLRYSIGLCSAPCTNKISKEDYLKDVKSAEMVLLGKIKDLVKKLNKKMDEFSRRENFELAIFTREKIKALENLLERQKMQRQKEYDEDIINYIVHKDCVYLLLFQSRRGILENKFEFEFEESENLLEEFLLRYYSENEIPKEIILPEEVEKSIRDYFRKISGKKIDITVPKKGAKRDLLELVKKNIEINLFGDADKLKDLREKLSLNETPKIIECFDISHLSGTSTVASMVQFRNAKAYKNNYRRFKIRTVDKIDDFASMKEVVRRRYYRLKKEGGEFPNLILIDGGKGQLSSALGALNELELKIPVISIAKREEEIFVPGKSEAIVLDKKSKALRFLQEVRDEAHRFAIKYNRLLRSKKIRD